MLLLDSERYSAKQVELAEEMVNVMRPDGARAIKNRPLIILA